MEISLDSMPQMPTAMANGVTRWPPVVKKSSVLLLTDVDPAAPAADDHARPGFAGAEAGVAERLARGNHAEERRPGVPPRIGAALQFLVALETGRVFHRDRRDPGGYLAGRGRDVELRDSPRGALAAREAFPVTVAANPERRNDADAGDDHARLPIRLHGVTITGMAFL